MPGAGKTFLSLPPASRILHPQFGLPLELAIEFIPWPPQPPRRRPPPIPCRPPPSGRRPTSSFTTASAASARSQLRKLLWWDCQHKLSYLSLHDPEVARRWPDLSHDRLMQEMVIIDRQGNRHWGAEAIRYLTRRLRRLWWASPFLHFPGSMFVWRPLYRWVARNRYRLSGGATCENGSCAVHR